MYIKNIYNLEDTNYSNTTIRDNNYHVLDKYTNNLYIYDNSKVKIDTNQLDKDFILLTYNTQESYYLMNENKSKKFKKVNFNYEEMSEFIIQNNSKKPINDIAYNSQNNTYLVVEDKSAYSIDNDGIYQSRLLNKEDFYTSYYNSNTCETIISPVNFKFTAIGTDGIYNYVAYNKNGSSFIAKLSKNKALIETLYIGDNLEINSIIFNNGLELSVTNGNNYIYEISSDYGQIDTKIQEIIDRIIILLNNVSINENNIAELVLAESEKIRKVIQISDNIEDILNVNESASTIINEAVQLENSQYNNLLIILEAIKELEKYLNE